MPHIESNGHRPNPVEDLLSRERWAGILKLQIQMLEEQMSKILANSLYTEQLRARDLTTVLLHRLQFYFTSKYAPDFFVAIQVIRRGNPKDQIGKPYTLSMNKPYTSGGGTIGDLTLIPSAEMMTKKRDLIEDVTTHILDVCRNGTQHPIYPHYDVLCDLQQKTIHNHEPFASRERMYE